MGFTRDDITLGIYREIYVKPFSIWLFLFMLVACLAHYLVFGPKKLHGDTGKKTVVRFTNVERIVHWVGLTCFLFLAITGIIFLLKEDSPGSLLRKVHGMVGGVFVLSIVAMFMVWWKNTLFVSCDKEWVQKLGGYLWIKGTCPAEKFNAGQKVFFWLVVILCGAVVSVTGILMVLARGDASPAVFLLHDLSAVAMTAAIIGHGYLSTIANPGTFSAMTSGKVSKEWAEHHHNRWFGG